MSNWCSVCGQYHDETACPPREVLHSPQWQFNTDPFEDIRRRLDRIESLLKEIADG